MQFSNLVRISTRRADTTLCVKPRQTGPLSWPMGRIRPNHSRFVHEDLIIIHRSFVSQLIAFIMMGFALYGLAHFYTAVSHDPIIKHTMKCTYCRQRINRKVWSKLILLDYVLIQRRPNDVSTAQVGSMAVRTTFTNMTKRSEAVIGLTAISLVCQHNSSVCQVLPGTRIRLHRSTTRCSQDCILFHEQHGVLGVLNGGS